MKRMLLATLDFPPLKGGVARMYAGLAGALPPDSVAVLTEPLPGHERFDAEVSYPVVRRRILGRCWPRSKWTWLRLLSARRRFRFDILLVGQILPLGYAALTLRLLFKIPYVVFVHGLDLLSVRPSRWKRFWAGRVLRGASLVAANSNWTKARALEFGANGDRIEILRPCPEARRFDRGLIEQFVNRRNLIGKRVVLSVGRLVSRKGQDMMIEALPDILRAHPDAVYVIVGHGPERERLMNLVSKEALGDRVIFTGEVNDDELSAAYGAAEVFVLPTREESCDAEGFGTVFLEAGAVGLPVVAGRGGGVAEAVIDGETGLVVDPRDPMAIAAAVNRLLSDRDLARRMGEAGKRRVMEEFQQSRQAENFLRAADRAFH